MGKVSIEKRLRELFIATAVVAMAMSITISTIFYINNIIKTAKDNINATMDYNGAEINKIIAEGIEFLSILENDITIQQAIRENDFENEKGIYAQRISLNSYLRILANNYSEDMDGTYLLLDDGRSFKSSVYPFRNDDFQNKKWYQGIISQENIRYDFGYEGTRVISNIVYPCFSIGRQIRNYKTGEVVGIIIIEYKMEILKKIIEKNSSTINLDFSVCDEITDRDWDVLHNKFIEKDNTRREKLGIITLRQSLENGWIITAKSSWFQMIKRELLITGMIIFIGIIIITTASVIFAIRFSKAITAPLHEVLLHMENIDQDNLKKTIAINTKFIEMEKLVSGLNEMTSQINDLFEKGRMVEQDMRKAHFMALQAQINPHFLYNTLDHIAWQIRVNMYDEALASIIALAKFFRLALNMGEELITLEKELEHTNYYLQIQTARFKDEISYQMNMEMEQNKLKELVVPKFILQPLVENSIYHGIRDVGETGKITVSVREVDQYTYILIHDDGAGIPKEKLKSLNESLMKGEINNRDTDKGYGILNVNQRIKYLFGMDYGLVIESIEGKFTTVKVLLPLANIDSQIVQKHKIHK